MSEFEKELLNKVAPHDRTHNGNELFIDGVLVEHFKDWQPPREHAIDTDKLSVEKLQEQLNTAKKALTEIAEFEPKKSAHKYWPDWHSIMMTTASEALAAIGGCDE